MKKFLLISIILITTLAPLSSHWVNSRIEVSSDVVHAQSGIQRANSTPGVDTTQNPAGGTSGISNANATPGVDTTQNPVEGGGGTIASVAKQTQKNAVVTECSGFFSGVTCALVTVLQFVAFIPIAVTSLLVGFAGLLLNLALFETVFNLGNNLRDMGGITVAWSALRDLANILFIFGLLAIAIGVIIGNSTYGNKKLLSTLIIVALVINFSLFFTKFVIDTSNIVAVQFYSAISGNTGGTDGSVGVSNAFMSQLGLTSAFNTGPLLDTLKQVGAAKSSGGGIGTMFAFSFFISIFFSITAFVFLFASIMLIIRMVAFIILMILSPLAFAAMALPATKNLADQWWEKLWRYALFAPMLLILFWVTVTVTPDVQRALGGSVGNISDVISTDGKVRINGIRMALSFLILSGLMLASIIISNKLSLAGSQKLSGWGKGMASSVGKWTGKRAGVLTGGVVGAAGRNTIGLAGSKVAGSDFVKKSLTLFSPTIGGAVRRGAEKVASASYDPRGVAGKDIQSYIGAPPKGGFTGDVKRRAVRLQKKGDEFVKATTRKDGTALEKKRSAILQRTKFAKTLRSGVLQYASPTIFGANESVAKNMTARAGKEKEVVLKTVAQRELKNKEREIGSASQEITQLQAQRREKQAELAKSDLKGRAMLNSQLSEINKKITEAEKKREGLTKTITKLDDKLLEAKDAEEDLKKLGDAFKDDKKEEKGDGK